MRGVWGVRSRMQHPIQALVGVHGLRREGGGVCEGDEGETLNTEVSVAPDVEIRPGVQGAG